MRCASACSALEMALSRSATPSQILARAPEVIIELRYARGDAASDMSAWNTLPSVPAVRNHRVYQLRGEEFVVPGPRVAAATEQLARTIQPDAFK